MYSLLPIKICHVFSLYLQPGLQWIRCPGVLTLALCPNLISHKMEAPTATAENGQTAMALSSSIAPGFLSAIPRSSSGWRASIETPQQSSAGKSLRFPPRLRPLFWPWEKVSFTSSFHVIWILKEWDIVILILNGWIHPNSFQECTMNKNFKGGVKSKLQWIG